jgi:hypothetical protein
MTLQKLIYLVLALILTAAPAAAQTRIQFFSAKVGALPQECQQEAAVLSPLLTQFHSPSWTWFVACDESDWKKVEDHIGFTFETYGTSNQPLAATDLEAKTTYVRGWALIHPFSDDLFAQPRHIVAHELGHITLNTHNESKAEKKGMELLSEGLVAKAP